MNHRSVRRWGLLALVVGLIGATVLGQAGVASADQGNRNAERDRRVSELDREETYENLGYGNCTKVQQPGKNIELAEPPSGDHWSLLVLQAGSPSSTPDWNTVVENPAAGAHAHPSGRTMSAAIRCHSPGGESSTEVKWKNTKPSEWPQGKCKDYTPTMVTVDPTTVTAGELVTISGSGVPGDEVTATLVPGEFLASVVVGPDGNFSITATIPVGTDPGNYKIVVASTQCPTSAKVTVRVVAPVSSSCGQSRAGRTFEQGTTVNWGLHVPSFSTTDHVTLRLEKSGSDFELYSGPWPAVGDSVETKEIPTILPTGKYWMVQEGTKSNGRGDMSKKCPVWIVQNMAMVSATSGPGSSESGSLPLRPLVAVGVLAVGLNAVIRLGGRRARLGTS